MGWNRKKAQPSENLASIYVRVSTRYQTNEGKKSTDTGEKVSLDNQIIECKRWCERNNKKIRKIVQDVDQTYNIKFKDRINFTNLLNELTAGETLVVFQISRLGRNSGEINTLISDLLSDNIYICAVDDNINTSKENDIFVMQLYGSLAEQESRKKANLVSHAMRFLKDERNKYLSSTPPWGFDLDKNTRHLSYNDDEMEIIHRIFDMKKNKMKNIDIADILNRENITKRGNKITIWTINNLWKKRDLYDDLMLCSYQNTYFPKNIS